MTTLEINATGEETFLDLPAGDVTLSTLLPVVFWCASADPSIRFKDYRTELHRLHVGTPIPLGAIPEGWKLAISTRADLPALYTSRPAKPAAIAEPALTADDIAAKNLQRQIARDMEHADIINTAMDMILARIQPPAPPYIDLSERPVEEVVGPLEALKAKIDRVRKTGSIDPSGVDDLEPLNTDDLINMVADNPPGSADELENAVRGIRGDARRRLTELLNVELSGLEQERAVGSAHANPKREQQIEYLLGLFARLGEI